MSENNKQARFDELIRHYTTALYLTTQILESDILKRKIKVTPDNYESLRRPFMTAVSSDLRQAIRTELDNELDALAIADAYFDELHTRGNEWEYADLEELFTKFKLHAQDVLEHRRNSW